MKYPTLEDYEKELFQDPEFRQAWKEFEPERRIADALIEARSKHGLSQAKLAKKMNTKQSVISRVETGKTSPSLSFLKRLAKALDMTLEVKFRPN